MQFTYYHPREIWQKEFMEECNAKNGMKKCHLEAEISHWKEETHSISISISIPNPFRPLHYIYDHDDTSMIDKKAVDIR